MRSMSLFKIFKKKENRLRLWLRERLLLRAVDQSLVTSKLRFIEKFCRFNWKDSESHLFAVALKDCLIEFIEKELTAIKHSLMPSTIYNDHYFLIVFIDPI